MAIVHVYPVKNQKKAHRVNGGGCWCEPEVLDVGLDADGKPARVFVHVARNNIGWFEEATNTWGI